MNEFVGMDWNRFKEKYLNGLRFSNSELEGLRDLTIQKLLSDNYKKCCSTCGFPLDMKRNPVFLKKDMSSYAKVKEGICKDCGHQKSGWTIKSVQEHYIKIIQKLTEAKELEIEKVHGQRRIVKGKFFELAGKYERLKKSHQEAVDNIFRKIKEKSTIEQKEIRREISQSGKYFTIYYDDVGVIKESDFQKILSEVKSIGLSEVKVKE